MEVLLRSESGPILAISCYLDQEDQQLTVRTSGTVIFEVVFTLQRAYKVPRERIAEAILPLIELSGISLPGKRAYRKMFALYRQSPLGFADCYHFVLMERLTTREILSFDLDFDRVPGVTRREE
jgi:predicted nucleic acid-binding protein